MPMRREMQGSSEKWYWSDEDPEFLDGVNVEDLAKALHVEMEGNFPIWERLDQRAKDKCRDGVRVVVTLVAAAAEEWARGRASGQS